MKLGFIGCGKMGAALIKGVLSAKLVEADALCVFDNVRAAADAVAAEHNLTIASSNRDLVSSVDAVVLCVKPDDALAAIKEAGESLNERLLISIVAGITIGTLQDAAGAGCRVVRAMPNTAALVQQSATAFAAGECVTPKDIDFVKHVFSSVGSAFAVKESLLDAVTGLSGSGPAYVYLFIEALSDGGVQAGLPRDLALELAVQTVLGAATMVQDTKIHPATLREMVTSPAGTTIAGLAALEHGRLRATVMNAVHTATRRAQELGKD